MPQLKFIQQEGSYRRNRSGNSLQSIMQPSNNSSGGGGADDRQDAETSQGLDIFQKSNRKEVSKQAYLSMLSPKRTSMTVVPDATEE